MKEIILTILLIFGLSISANAERETWLCGAFKATSDNSTYMGPFILYETEIAMNTDIHKRIGTTY